MHFIWIVSSRISSKSGKRKEHPTHNRIRGRTPGSSASAMLPIFHSQSPWRHAQRRDPSSPQQQHASRDHQPAFYPSLLAVGASEDVHTLSPSQDGLLLTHADADAAQMFPSDTATANQLSLRFAHMLADRQHVRGLLLTEDDHSECTQPLRGTSRRKPTRSKNCASVRRNHGSTKLSRLAKARVIDRQRLDEERAELEATIQQLRSTIAGLERSHFLEDSALLTWRANRTGVAVEICQQYFAHFARGYDPSNPMLVQRSAATRAFMFSVVEQDVVCRDFIGLDTFLRQWQKYTTSYENFSSRMCSLTLVDEEDQYVSVRAAAEMRFAFNDVSLKMLYPRFYQQMQVSPEAKAIGEKLLGKECRLAFDLVLHFNQQGRVFAHESRVHLASALLSMISDPFAVMKVLNASLMTEDGHWKTPDNQGIREKANEIPKSIL